MPENVSYDYTGKTVLITGGARGQGLEHARAFAAAGAQTVIADAGSTASTVPYALADESDLACAVDSVKDEGGLCVGKSCDVRDGGQVEALVDEVVAEFGAIDVLINNAGIENITLVTEMTETEWDEMVDSNLKSVFQCSRFAARTMIERKRGKILNTASTSGMVGLPSQAHYCAAKHGVLGFTKVLAIELAPHGINVNAVCPGGIDSPMTDGMLNSRHGQWLMGLEKLTGPMNMLGEGAIPAVEVTNAMLWLASDAAEFVTGAALVVDGGYTLK